MAKRSDWRRSGAKYTSGGLGPERNAQSGQIVTALVNHNETTLKYFIKENDRTILRAANPNYDDIELKAEDQIQGVVIKVLKDPPPVNAYREFIYLKEGHNQEWNQVIEDAISYGIKPEQVRNMMEVQWGMLQKMLGKA
ncbi:Peptidase S24-like [Desulfotomaculum arcticum]|uniref:Peptidase S24-like n=1 Tax=Desulfotruncus arcticus DSM 17038 TaxID=1121424 RepID=A0A1I2TFE4_9FIRM|nr:S24 family peptidase [Desulfotruncus arcticus]SFG62789.1 Peptidase S24-like [Desulfotomaculum arcticum] [Desulfotruncus arcticus DSM 17038]